MLLSKVLLKNVEKTGVAIFTGVCQAVHSGGLFIYRSVLQRGGRYRSLGLVMIGYKLLRTDIYQIMSEGEEKSARCGRSSTMSLSRQGVEPLQCLA